MALTEVLSTESRCYVTQHGAMPQTHSSLGCVHRMTPENFQDNNFLLNIMMT